MREARIGVACICTKAGYVVFDNGIKTPIIGFLDDDRKPTDDPEQYAYYEFGDDDLGFGIGNYDVYDMPSWEEH